MMNFHYQQLLLRHELILSSANNFKITIQKL